jgi:hypothetical protein
LFVFFCQRKFLPDEALFCQQFLYLPFPCMLGASSNIIFSSYPYVVWWLSLFRDLLIIKLPTILFQPVLLALALNSRYPPC